MQPESPYLIKRAGLLVEFFLIPVIILLGILIICVLSAQSGARLGRKVLRIETRTQDVPAPVVEGKEAEVEIREPVVVIQPDAPDKVMF